MADTGYRGTDVTAQVDFGPVDDECLPLTKCVCGHAFKLWEEVVSIYPEHPWTCPQCGAKLVFANAIRVFQL